MILVEDCEFIVALSPEVDWLAKIEWGDGASCSTHELEPFRDIGGLLCSSVAGKRENDRYISKQLRELDIPVWIFSEGLGLY